jgi:hypothetical protein
MVFIYCALLLNKYTAIDVLYFTKRKLSYIGTVLIAKHSQFGNGLEYTSEKDTRKEK